jgi:hypothetical protein
MSGCNGGKSLQNTFAPDPKLKEPTDISAKSSDIPATSANALPADFPLYPQAKLQSTEETKERGTVTTWTTPDPIEFVYKFYQTELPGKQWEIVTAPSDRNPQLEVKQAQTTISIAPQTNTDKQQTGVTTYTISLLGASTATPTATPAASNPTPSTAPIVSTKPSSTL